MAVVVSAACAAQQEPGSSSSRIPDQNIHKRGTTRVPEAPQPQNQPQNQDQNQGEPAGTNQVPALMDPAGPQVSLQTSESLFDIAAALNTCGYNDGLAESNPVRMVVRKEVNQAVAASAEAQDDRDKLCHYLVNHEMNNPAQSLAQFVSLALYLTPPPQLTPTVPESELPPDAVGVELMLPLLRRFVADAGLHVIWLENRPAYDGIVGSLHASLTQMIVRTNYYLKMPASTANGLRFLVVIEPLLSPEETNARVYGTDYVVVASPKQGHINMQMVRHAYLHYMIEPLLYSWQDSTKRMAPILKTVQDAPLQFRFKSDIMALTVECLIKAIEARIRNTGVQVTQIPPGLLHSQVVPYLEQRNEDLQKVARVREQWVQQDMAQGFVMTGYFYRELILFEKTSQSLSQAIGPIVYGMDIISEVNQARHITFDQNGAAEMMSHGPPPAPQGLDLAELDLVKGDIPGAVALAQKVVNSQKGDVGRANFILARADLMNGKMEDAQSEFQQAVVKAQDPRTLAWSHIFLGRILDVEGERSQAIAEYKAALATSDGRDDTQQAAQSGLKKPFTVPTVQGSSDDSGKPAGGATPPSPAPAANAASGNGASPQQR